MSNIYLKYTFTATNTRKVHASNIIFHFTEIAFCHLDLSAYVQLEKKIK